MSKNVVISIIVVHYKVKKELFSCLKSIYQSNSKFPYEVIVVDNDDIAVIGKELKENFPQVNYIRSNRNIGYGAGNNLGVKYAKGKYLFFLNPDTELHLNCIETLTSFLDNDPKTAIVAPLFLDKDNKMYPLQGSKKLTPLRAIFTLSFLYKLLPRNSIAKDYLLHDWNKTDIKEVDVVPGTGFVIRRNIFEKVRGFDEKFFLYFEEFDLCNRVKALGNKIYIQPEAKVKHLWEASTKKAEFNIEKVFAKSRFYYFRKYYGIIVAYFVELFMRLNKTHIFLGGILMLGTFLRFYKLQELMPFIGDQGWFYISARDMLLTGQIPLVGIASSHVWLHQGPLWAYALGIMLWLFNFNPVAGAYLTAFLGVITVLTIYIACSTMFSKNLAIVATGLYATSPLIINHSRFAYHTSPIPLFTVLFIIFLYKWVNGKSIYFPLSIFTLAVLYNLELATAPLWFALIGILIYGFLTKKKWLEDICKKNIVLLSAVCFLIPMLPILVYDITHGFPQTVGFAVWIIYKIIKFIIHIGQLFSSTSNSDVFLSFFYNNIQRLLFLPDGRIAVLLFITSLFFFFYSAYHNKKYNMSHIIIGYIFIISGIGLLVNQTPSEAYLPLFFPVVIIMLALLLFNLMNKKRFLYVAILLYIFIMLTNSYSIVNNEYSYIKKGQSIKFIDRLKATRKIVDYAHRNKYNLIGKGWLNEFESYTMNYQYLTWWMGNAPVKENSEIKIFVSEEKGKIIIEKK